MAAPKTIPPSSELQPPLAPYEHKLNNNGTECVKDCPACHWDKRTSDAPWNLRKPPSQSAVRKDRVVSATSNSYKLIHL